MIFYRFSILLVAVSCIHCGKHDIENFGYVRQVNAAGGEAAVNWPDRFEEAVNQNKDDEFKNLLEEDEAQFNVLLKNGRTPLIHSVISGSNYFIYLLLQKDVDIDQTDTQGKTALDYAVEMQKDRAQLMLNPDLQIQFQSVLFLKIIEDSDDVASEVKRLLESGTDPNYMDTDMGETPLTMAIKKKSLAVTTLIRWTDPELGLTPVDINLPNMEDKKPLTIALETNFRRAILALQALSAEE
ncbi:MAG: ankyrin repeat domain-containing protein [Bdellovibrionaceae bacterium]|nr:ankyrin repeat domain-containing protein [Pseudobdellovibrionaceae bacterium]